MLKESISNLGHAISALQTEIDSYIDSKPDVTEACEMLLNLNQVKAELKMMYDSFAYSVGHIMGDTSNILINGGEVEKSYATKRTGWQHKELASVVAQKLTQRAVDMDTGEVMVSNQELISQLLNYVQPSYWKVGELSKLGLNADNYCTAGETKISIIVRKGGQVNE